MGAAFGSSTDFATQHFARASPLAQNGKADEAEQEYRLGLALDPKSTEGYNNLAALYFQKHQYREAAEAFRKAHGLRPADPHSLYVHEILGEAYDKAGQPKKAEEEFKQAIAASPQMPELHFMLGYLYWRWKRYAEAVESLEAETRIAPNFAPSYYYLGDVALRNRQFDLAEKHFRAALRLDPSNGEADLGLGRVLADTGQYQSSIHFLRLAVERLPDSVEAHYWLGKTLIRVGQSPEGQRELAEVKKMGRLKQQKASDILNRVVAPSPPAGAGTP